MTTWTLVLLTLSVFSVTQGFLFGNLGGMRDEYADVSGFMFDWGISAVDTFVDRGFHIGGSTLGALVDPFGWWRRLDDDHWHRKRNRLDDDHWHRKRNRAVCPARSDIVFLIDTSDSTSRRQFDQARHFVARLTDHFQVGDRGVRFAALTFSSRVQKVFDFDTYSNRDDISMAFTGSAYLGGPRRTYQALDYIHQHDIFHTLDGARDDASKVVVVITGGSSDDVQKTIEAADILKRDCHVVVVGVGHVPGTELRNMAGSSRNVFVADNYDSMERIEQRVARCLCELPEADGNIPATGSGTDSCATGFEQHPTDPSSCVDANECETDNSCEQTCVNLVGSYRCTCRAGYAIDPKDTSKCLNITKCTAPVDILFALDAASSIGAENFQTQQRFVAKLTQHFKVGPRGALFAGLLFATDVRKLFDLDTYTSRPDVAAALLAAPYIEGETNTHLALKYIVANRMFSAGSGGRPNAPDVVVVVTDGSASKEQTTKAAADSLKARGVEVFAVGVGEQADLQQLVALASSSQHVLVVADFDLLDYIEQELADRVCSSVNAPDEERIVETKSSKETDDEERVLKRKRLRETDEEESIVVSKPSRHADGQERIIERKPMSEADDEEGDAVRKQQSKPTEGKRFSETKLPRDGDEVRVPETKLPRKTNDVRVSETKPPRQTNDLRVAETKPAREPDNEERVIKPTNPKKVEDVRLAEKRLPKETYDAERVPETRRPREVDDAKRVPETRPREENHGDIL
ncbi:hypothetical protein BsWGS_25845 [Bradybaena similaris]